MATKRQKKTGIKLAPFAPIYREEMESKAYQDLSGSAAKALPYFRWIDGVLKKKFGGDYNGIFDFTYTEAETFGFARRTFSRVITDLNAKGFIDIVLQGGKRGLGYSNSKYILSKRWQKYGTGMFEPHPRYPSEPK